MMKKKLTYSLTAVLLILACFGGWRFYQTYQSSQKMVHTNIPTLFFHGGNSSYHAEEHMVSASQKAGVSKTKIIAFVDKDGHVTLKGKLKKSDKNPLIMVNYADSGSFDFPSRGRYATNVVKALQKVYDFKQVNMVGHSAGNIAVIYYMLQNGQNKSIPQVYKYVAIAGHYAGLDFDQIPDAIKQPKDLTLDKDGKPNHMNATYQEMTALRDTYPKNQTEVINLIGDIGGHTDGTVLNVSTLSLKYLIADRAKSYQEKTFTGKNARHSKLHNNPQVDKTLIDFLWKKS